jgi:hypothetical protein
VATHVLHDLVDHELRVSPHVEALDACLDGDSEATKEGLCDNPPRKIPYYRLGPIHFGH